MLETSSDDLFLAPYQEEMVAKLLSSETSDGDAGLGLSLSDGLLPLIEPSRPPLIPWVCSTRYKTELCTTYASTGLCTYAERCQFAHGLHELHVPFCHPKYKTELCHSYHTVGTCAYGTRCLFVHSPKEQRPAFRRRHRNIPSSDFGVGCSLEAPVGGEKSPSMPDSPAKERKLRGALCRTFTAFGFCVYGTRCRFQHSLPSKFNSTDLSQSPGEPLSPLSTIALSQSNNLLGVPSNPFSPTSPTWSCTSSPTWSCTSSSPPSPTDSPLNTPPVDPMAHNAFTFSSQHLNELLLPLALQLKRLESSQAMAASTRHIWDNRSVWQAVKQEE